MTKKEMAAKVAIDGEIGPKCAERIIDSYIGLISAELKKGHDVSVFGFGTFKVVDKPERKARNPHTGDEIIVKAHKAVKFRATPALTKSLMK